ncbi:NMT1/THI5-like protein [Niveomyces insectorum RCEF 264]|uniref:Thiamine pyrimidine synthase n=1 Tax=Niveomyces insectorum RCEF 264 TaxID=1081102 RepID=A0A167S3F6_9HYPO|nr:NMT1/THI5-like protein [Niveomyces insectorum RCEF 264]
MSLMQRLVRERPMPTRPGRWPTAGQLWRFLKRSAGFAPTAEAAILAEMVGALRVASDAAFDRGGWGAVVDTVAIAAPYVPAWADSLPSDSVVNDALVLAGLRPRTYESSDPVYLVETSAVLADSGLRTCKLRWCAGHGPAVGGGEDGGLQSRIAFFISFTNDSLYTSFQRDGCFYFPVYDNLFGVIDPEYGLDRKDVAATPTDFWHALRDQLLRRVSEYAEFKQVVEGAGYWDAYHIEILVAGEAAGTQEFLDVVRQFAKTVPDRLSTGENHKKSVDTVVPDNPAFAAARGAAVWLGMSMDESYCDEFYRSGEIVSQRATPYHAPLFLAQAKGYFKDEGIKVAILEPNDPSDVTEIIGSGKIDLGFKAMIHTLAAKARGFPVVSVASLLDEPFTGVLYLKSSGITTDFRSLKGKRIGYVGEFGKIQIDELTRHYGMTPDDYTAIRCGMDVSKAIIEGHVDAGIGLENVQMVELEAWLESQGRPRSDVQMLRIDELAELGCCCFCSILYIGHEKFVAENPDKVRAFLRAVKRATDYVLATPEAAWREYADYKPAMATELNRKMFERSFAYFSRDLKNVARDWAKVTAYGKRLGVLDAAFKPNYTNEHLAWALDAESADPTGDQKRMVVLQKEVAANGGCRRLPQTVSV